MLGIFDTYGFEPDEFSNTIWYSSLASFPNSLLIVFLSSVI